MDTMPSPKDQLIAQLKQHRALLMISGILLTICGFIFIGSTTFATLTSVYMFGFIMIFSGIIQLFMSFKTLQGMQKWGGIIFAIFYLIAGILSFKSPLATATALTWILAVFLIIGGISRFIHAFQMKPLSGWGWILMSGVLLFITGILILNNPTSPLWLLGLFLGVELLMRGINFLMLAFAIKRA